MLKKIISLCLCCCLVFATGIISRAEDSEGIMPLALQYINVDSVSLTFYISDDGFANIQYTVSVSGKDDITVKTYIEKNYLSLFWTRVDIGTEDNKWIDNPDKRFYIGNHGAQLIESGLYRATVEIISGSDKIVKRAEFRYNKNITIGDVNDDSRITAADARLILRFSADLERFSASQKEKSDVNGDGRITAADARLVLRISASLGAY